MQQESPQSESTATPQEGPSEKITRRSHRKSRAGCKQCKTRRIKCDEEKPSCANCKRRNVRCSYETSKPAGDSVQAKVLSDFKDFPLSEIELTYHWTTTTCQSLSIWPSGAAGWRSLMEDVAFHHQHVLHLMFALTALQLSQCRPDRREAYVAKADYHYEKALSAVTPDLAAIDSNNCDAIFVSVQLICFVNWARGPEPGEFLAFGEHGRSDWLVMFRGIRTTLSSYGRHNFTKTLEPAKRSKLRPLPPMEEPCDYMEQLSELRAHVTAVCLLSEKDDNAQAIDILQECYFNRYNGVDSELHVSFAWLYKLSDAFLDRLQAHDSIALVIYAHFVVLMHEMERFWYLKGWTHHVMSGIFAALATEHIAWIRWPMAKIGWIAP
ncbi:hypothetical protein BKA63DRAFT_121959 [Paraphoma chrysanthemicola]|nr:hypothetical protein BKA63DRAFT_121959 [Paraphoma chrysanthemicola]